ncbi:hypothetical protein ANCDUO_03777 [Ancylostoma duodenale]|uniref:OTU domain-containing protein n=1 Tax=Ancylostoma duodenale TaxID=51022 RepID=A0A0C2D887_9BILA|nr:hypothetical protein ANCDUO_03777 [Ancylostoma duodenale]
MEYDPVESAEFYNKAKDLLETYCDVRLIRRDGNCFYRAVLVAQVELMLNDPAECSRFEQVCKGWQDRLIKLGYPDFTTNDFCEVHSRAIHGSECCSKWWPILRLSS